MRNLNNIRQSGFRLDAFARPLLEYKRYQLLEESGAGKDRFENVERMLNDLVKEAPFRIMYHTKRNDPL
ncbi:MAG: hypothetical protein ACHQET_11950 [Chitinophagales bacterium]